MNTHPCLHCGQPVPARYRLHKGCLDLRRASFPYRAFALERDGYVCTRCPGWWNDLVLRAHQRTGTTRRVDVDHIVPLGAGGDNAPQNLQVLCKAHHRAKTRRDIAAMRGRANANPARLLRWAIPVCVALWATNRVVRNVAEGVAAGDVGGYIVAAGLLAWVALLLFTLHALRAKTLARLRRTIVEVTQDSVTKRGMLRARRWRLVHIDGLWLPRLRPTSVLVRYPHTFPDHDPGRQTELEARVAAKMGGTWYAQWNTTADRVLLRSPDPLVGLEGVPWPNRDAATLSLWDPIPVGVGEDGHPVTMGIVGKNLLIGGEPESGKSVAQSLVTATAALDPSVVLYGIDGKRVELEQWRPAMERLVHDRTDAIALLEDLRATMDFRYDLLRDKRLRKVTRDDGLDLHVLIIDELALFTAAGSKAERDRFTEALRDVIARGRAAGVIVVAATQRPSATVVSTDVRDLIGYRWAMRISTPQASDMILGQGQASAGYSSARVAAETRGIGYLLAEGSMPRRLRSYYIDDATLTALATRAAGLRSGNAPVPVGANGRGDA